MNKATTNLDDEEHSEDSESEMGLMLLWLVGNKDLLVENPQKPCS